MAVFNKIPNDFPPRMTPEPTTIAELIERAAEPRFEESDVAGADLAEFDAMAAKIITKAGRSRMEVAASNAEALKANAQAVQDRIEAERNDVPDPAASWASMIRPSRDIDGSTIVIRLTSGGTVTLIVNADILALPKGDRDFVFTLVDAMRGYDA